MLQKATLAAVAAAGFAFASPAQASTNVGTITFTIGNCASVCTGGFFNGESVPTFDDYYTLTFPNDSTVASQVGEITVQGNVDFTSVYLVGPGPGGTVYNFNIANGNPSTAWLAPTSALMGDYELHLIGTNDTWGNGYSGTVTLAAIPEPAAWALMILGFGAVGFAMRRRNNEARTTRASLTFA